MSRYLEWTPQRVGTLIQLYADGASVDAIAQHLMVTPGAVRGKLHRLRQIFDKRGAP